MSQLRISHLSDARQVASAVNGALRRTDALDLSADQLTLNVDRNVDVTGNANLSGVVKISGTQVLGAQGAAVANATNSTDVITQLNALLSRLRAHGIIAT